MNNLSENDNRRMLETCIKMLVEDVKLSTYWHTYPNGEVELNSNVEDYIDFAREEADHMTDREEAEHHINMISDYETIALDLAKSIMGRTIDYYEVLEYSESNKKYSKFAELAWKLVKHNFRIWKYSSVAHIKYNNLINLNDPYIGIEQVFQFFYRIDESDPIFWHLDQEFQSNANEYGVEEACTIVPISNPEQFDHQKDMWNTFVELFKTFQSYG
jgi:Zn-dependent M32 family carboxypeptidase